MCDPVDDSFAVRTDLVFIRLTSDSNHIEELFADGSIQVLVSSCLYSNSRLGSKSAGAYSYHQGYLNL
jgi:hypothetical protein